MNPTSDITSADASTCPNSFSAWVQKRLPWLYLAYALPAVIFLSVTMGPFQVADELAHCMRAEQISEGSFLGQYRGGNIDDGLIKCGKLYRKMWFHNEVKHTPSLAREAGAIHWSGSEDFGHFGNTAQYGPILYAPQAIGFWIGRFLGLSVAQTMVVARLINGMTACGVGFLALSICRRGRTLMFTALLLPMVLSEMASAAQDALIITLSALLAGVVSRILSERRPARTGEFLFFAFVVMATTLARPTQIALALLTPAFFTRSDTLWRRKVLIGLVAILPIIYWQWLLTKILCPLLKDVSVSGQFHYIIDNPLSLPTAIVKSFFEHQGWPYLKTFIGELGFCDTPLPNWYYKIAAGVVILAMVAPGNRGRALWPGLLGTATFFGLLVLQFLALYVTWTPVGKRVVDGFQGRYVLPALPMLGWWMPDIRSWFSRGPTAADPNDGGETVLAQPKRRLLIPSVADVVWLVLILMPALTLSVLPGVVMRRYYGNWQDMGEALRLFLLP